MTHPTTPRLSASGLCLTLDGRALLRDLDLHLHAGEIAVLEGASGSGKSTLLKVLATLLDADRGRLTLDDHEASAMSSTAWRRRVAYVPQSPPMFDGLVDDNLAAGPALSGRALSAEQLAALLARVGLDRALGARAARSLSGGERMRVAIARALANEPSVLLLDEPTAALDEESAATVVSLVRSLALDGMSALVVTHSRLHAAALGGTRLRLADGALSPAEEPPCAM